MKCVCSCPSVNETVRGMKNPFRKLGAMFGKGRKGTIETDGGPAEEGPSDGSCAGGGSHKQLVAPSLDTCRTGDASCIPLVVLPDEEPDERADAGNADTARGSDQPTPKLLTPRASPSQSVSSMVSDEGSGACAVQTVAATTNECQELTALNSCGDLERMLDSQSMPAALMSEIVNIRNEVLWQHPPFYDFCVIASDADYDLSVQFRNYLARTYQLVGCTLYDGFITLGADLFDCYEVMMDHSHKAFFLITDTFSQNKFCRRLQSGAVFQSLMSKVKKDREKCVPVYPNGICRAPLALSGVAGLVPTQKEMMSRVLLNTYLPCVREHRAVLDKANYEKRCIEFKKRVVMSIETFRLENPLESSVSLLQVENVSQNSNKGNTSEILPSNDSISGPSNRPVSDALNQNSLGTPVSDTPDPLVPFVPDVSSQNSVVPSLPDLSNQNSIGDCNTLNQNSAQEVCQLQTSDSNEEIRKTLEQVEEARQKKVQNSPSRREENVLRNHYEKKTSESGDNVQSPQLQGEKDRRPQKPVENVNKNVNTKPQNSVPDQAEVKNSESHSSNDDSDDSDYEDEEEEGSSDDDTHKLPEKICEALKNTNIGNSPGATVVNIEGSTGTVSVGPSITVVVNFAQNEKKRSPRRQSPRRPSSDSD